MLGQYGRVFGIKQGIGRLVLSWLTLVDLRDFFPVSDMSDLIMSLSPSLLRYTTALNSGYIFVSVGVYKIC